MSLATNRVLAPASPVALYAERHAMLCTAYRERRTAEITEPSTYRLALAVVKDRTPLEIYRARG